MSESIITLKEVSYSYPHAGEARAALQRIDLEIRSGEFLAVVGANGSGKTTLVKLLNGLLLPSRGEVIVKGMSTSDPGNIDTIRETVGMVFQNPESQIVANSVEDDIAFGLENIGLPVEEIDQRIDAALAAFGLEGLRDKEPHWLSGGQKQSTVLAGVMALMPDVLVLDEPASMLDPQSQNDFMANIEGLRRDGATIVYISHVMREVVSADRIIVMREGGVAFEGGPRQLFGNADLLEEAGLRAPLPVRLSRELAKRGLEIPLSLTLEELVT
jgi:energy-coupling factor transport system ATP-binding protein